MKLSPRLSSAVSSSPKATIAKGVRLLVVMTAFGASGCGKDSPKPTPTPVDPPNPIASIDATKPFDASKFMAAVKINPKSSGVLEITGKTGADANYNGYYVNYDAGTVTDGEYWLIMTPAIGANVPSPSTGQLITASGMEYLLLPVGNELDDNGEYNAVDPAKTVDIKFNERGTVVNFNKTANKLEEGIDFTMVADGTVGHVDSFSTKYLVDKKAEMNSAVTQGSYGVFYVDFTGTKDEGTSDKLSYEVDVPKGATVTVVNDLKFKVNLPVGVKQQVTARVRDQFRKEIAVQSYSLEVPPPNVAPEFPTPPTATPNPTDAFTPVNITVPVLDSNGDDVTITLSFVGDNLGATFDRTSDTVTGGSGTKVFTMTPQFVSGNVQVRIAIDDGNGGMDSYDYWIWIQ